MKSSEEMYESLLLRRNEYVKSRTKRHKMYALTVVAFALILLVGGGLWFIQPQGTEKTAQTENTEKDNTGNNGKVTSLADEPWHVWIGSLQFVDMTAYNRYDSATDDTELHLWFAGFPKDRTNGTDDTAWNEYLRTSAQDEAEFLRNYCISVTVKADTRMINGYYFECDITKAAFDRLASQSEFTFMVRSLDTGEASTDFIDQIGTIIKDGREYRQIFSDNTDGYTKKDCIGRASEFDGTYSGTPDVDGDVYTVNETESVLVIHLDNGGTVYLKCAE